MSIVTIVGAGMMGSAMARPAADNGHEVRLVGTPLDRDIIARVRANGRHPTLKAQMPEGVKAYGVEELGEALEGCDLVIGGVSSFGVDWFTQTVTPLIPAGVPALMITKGLRYLDGELVPIPRHIMRQAGRPLSVSAVGGPCICFELMQRQHTCIAFCGDDRAQLAALRTMLATPYYHIDITRDMPGVECAVAMKNAYALGVSLAIGMAEQAFGEGVEKYNPQAALFGQSVKEMAGLIDLIGGQPGNVKYAAGDLYVTIFGGRTRRLGTLLGRGLPFDRAKALLQGVTLESVAIATTVMAALRDKGLAQAYPLLEHIDALIREGQPAPVPWERFEETLA